MAVGAPYASNNEGNLRAGMVQVYELRQNSVWEPRGEALYGRSTDDQFGSAVVLSSDGRILVVSEPTYDGPNGDRSGNIRSFVFSPMNRYDPMGQELFGQAATDHFGISLPFVPLGRPRPFGVSVTGRVAAPSAWTWPRPFVSRWEGFLICSFFFPIDPFCVARLWPCSCAKARPIKTTRATMPTMKKVERTATLRRHQNRLAVAALLPTLRRRAARGYARLT